LPEPDSHSGPSLSKPVEPTQTSAPTPGAVDSAAYPAAPTPLAVDGTAPTVEARLLDLPVAGAVYAGLLFAAFTLTDPDVVTRGESEATIFFWLQALDDGVLAAVALAFGRLRFPGSWHALGFRQARTRWWAIAPAGGGLAALVAWAINLALDRWGWPPPTHPVESVLGAAQGPRDVIVILLAVTVLVPIAEETFFRGFAYRLLRARLGALAAIATTSLLFALVHGLEVSAWLPVLPVGVVFAVLAECSGALGPAMLAHAVVNALAVLAT